MFLDGIECFFSKILGNQKLLDRATEEIEAAACLLAAIPPEFSFEQPFRKAFVSPLRRHKLLRDEFGALCKQMRIGKIRERYMLCAYAASATGRPHDREVSAIISVVTGKDLDENALRMWRLDNKKMDGWFFEAMWRLAHKLGNEQKESD